jgi:5-(carboxyamino)imidazole ribonucleotide synthase
MNVLVLGSGQLARMMALATKPLNIELRAYDVSSQQVINPLAHDQVFGDLASGIAYADVITAEFEHIEHDVLALCEASGKLRPTSQSIKIGGDRRLEKQLLAQCQVNNAQHVIVEDEQSFNDAIEALSLPIILKSALAGYDGKGQWRLKSLDQTSQTWLEVADFFAGSTSDVPQGLVAEQMVPFDREVSLVGMRSTNGEIKVYPLTENHHTDGVLSVSLALETDQQLQQEATEVFTRITNALGYVGTLAIEFFQVGDQLLVNEIAPRVHNSGHWTQQGADTCQFENHIRAVCGLPLGGTQLLRPTAMINILGEDTIDNDVLAIAGASVHWYGKTKRAGRKMGHINISGDTPEQLQQRLVAVAQLLPESAFSDIKAYINKRS